MILNETVAAIADAIREKTGKSELIKPVDFAEEIKGITAGGDAPSGGGLSYFAIDTSIIGADAAFAYGSFLAKVVESSGSGILPTAMAVFSGIEEAMKGLKAIAIDENAKVYLSGQLLPLWGGLVSTVEEFISMGVLTPITEAEFYDLNA